MNNITQIINDYRTLKDAKVTLPPIEYGPDGHNIFDLSNAEQEMSPEDWAWQFLRLSEEYQSDYQQARDRNLTRDILCHLLDPDEYAKELSRFNIVKNSNAKYIHARMKHRINITKASKEDICRKKYGISTWLDPRFMYLPKLKESIIGQSWFFPLYTFEFSVKNWNEDFYEGRFGYEISQKNNTKSLIKKTPTIEASIDYTTPADSKLQILKKICQYIETQINKSVESKIFSINCFPAKGVAAKIYTEIHPLISTLGSNKDVIELHKHDFSVELPLGRKVRLIEDKLREAYLKFKPENLSTWAMLKINKQEEQEETEEEAKEEKNKKEQTIFSFQKVESELVKPLPHKMIKSDKDGNPYKRMLFALQLTQSDFSINDINAILVREFNYPSGGAWFCTLQERLEQSLKQADRYVSLYYKWLVLSQYNNK